MLKDLTRADLPRLVVLSRREVPRDTPVEILGTVVEQDGAPLEPAVAAPPHPVLQGPHAPIAPASPAGKKAAAGEGQA